MTTTGYRSRRPFAQVMGAASSAPNLYQQDSFLILRQGTLAETGREFDLALTGEGFFQVRTDAGLFLTRAGQFRRADDGRLLGAGDAVLQGVGGGDIIIPAGDPLISEDGVVTVDGKTVATVAVMQAESVVATGPDGLLASTGELTPAQQVSVRQGFLEQSNVSLGAEMVTLMEAVRRAETGQRLMNVYDDLLGRAVTSFGQSA